MNNELGRKITSLTLMTIMLTWSGSMAFTGSFLPEAEAANQYLWASVESYDNHFYGPQVLEIVVTDPTINALDTAYGMPDVTIDGKKVIMAQGVDGSWYAYVADATFASTVDALYTENEDGKGADYGTWCNPGTNLEYGPYAGSTPTRKAVSPLVPSETRGVIIPHQLGNGTVAGATTNGNVAGGGYANEATNSYAGQYGNIGTAQVTYTKGTSISTSYCDNDVNGQTSFESAYGSGIWLNSTSVAHTQGAGGTGVNASGEAINNVVREARALSNGTSDYYGNIGLGPNLWPFIQVYDFTRYMTYDLVYERGGADESIGIVFDRPGGQGLTFDRDVYGLLHEVGVTITNNELNIDPTDEDSWTYNTQWQNGTVYYQVYDENGANEAIGNNINDGLVPQSNAQMQSNWGSDEGTLQIDRNGPNDSAKSIVNFQSNSDTATLTCTSGACYGAGFATTEVQATFVETGSNTGVFKNWDEDLKTNIFINAEAARGTQAIFLWNDQQYSVLHMPSWGTVSFNTEAIGSEWNSGEIVGVTVTDNDMNLDARTLNQQAISSNQTIVPAIKIGSPITLASVGAIDYTHVATFNRDESDFGHTINLDTISTQCSSNYGAAGTDASYVSCYEKYSERAILTTSTNPPTTAEDDILKFNYTGATVRDLEDLIASANGTSAYTYIQYDFRAFNGGDSGDYYLNFTIGDNSIDSTSASTSAGSQGHSLFPSRQSTGLVGSVLINAPDDCTTCTLNDKKMIGFGSLTATDDLRVFVEFSLLNGITGFDMATGTSYPIAMDFVTYGQSNDGVASSDRHNNAIYRLEVDETGANTGTYVAEVEYIMLNQLNVNATATYNATKHYDDATVIIVHNDLTDEDEVRINYLDMGADGVETQVADQLAAPTHSGVVEFDNDSYKEADTVVVTLTDSDLNTNPDIINIYTTVTTVPTTLEGISTNGYNDVAYDQVGKAGFGTNSVGDNNGRMLDITFDDEQWLAYSVGSTTCSSAPSGDDGLAASGFTLVETGSDTGVFTGDFQVPAEFCARSSGSGTVSSVMGTDIEVNYVDYRDASGEIIEVGDGAGVRANTGSVSLDRTVYPVPFGTVNDFATESAKSNPNGRSLFPVHATGITSYLDAATETIGNGDLTIHIRVDDPDYDLSASGEDKINENTTTSSNRGPLKIYVSRGSDSLVLATAGADTAQVGKITIGSTPVVNSGTQNTVELGPILETAPDSGVFELDMTVRYTDGPASSNCPSITDNWTPKNGDTNETGTASNNGETTRFASAATTGDYCILQGDVITVEYSDQNDASGNSGVAFDSATFDLRNGVLQTDKSVYIIGSDIIMTLIEPDLDLESDESETWDLDLIEWDGDAATVTMGNNGGVASSFDPEPSDFRETGDSTGIFQIVIEMPSTLSGTALDRGEAIGLEYSDWGPSGSNYVGEEYQDVALSIYTSNFGATIELDQKVYTWTDKVYITIVAPDHNFDSGLVDQIGDTDDDPLIVQTRSQKLTSYKLAETGTDTGIFSGEVILKGFNHDADGDPSTGDATNGYDVTAISSASGSGPTDGAIKAEDDDGLTISYEFNEDEVVVGSALIRWNIGEIQWLDTSYPAGGNGVVRVVDPDMNWDPENVNNFEVDVWSDSDAGGISLMVTETNEATGIFEGTVTFTADSESSGHRLRVAEGDTITVEYEDNTLPDPYTRGDDLDVTGTALIGTVVPPLDRAPASNARVVDSFGNSLSEVSVDQQVQIEADLVNGQDRDQSFAYLVQVQDGNGVTVSLAWITGQLAAGQSFSPALSWIPSTSGSYEATVFVWESVDNPTALSDTVSVSIRVV
jgi:hypothetical protein